ncbi:MAG TPA: OsmC family protein [Dehalococcoidia bacterium]|nr:OsmC family protein [Dehalococcoidia bacterium]
MTLDLRALQKPLKESYRADPDQAKIVITARGQSTAGGPITCNVDIGRAIYEAQAHAGVGGAGTAACSGDLLLGALAACKQVTVQMVAAAMGLPLTNVEVTVEGDLDLRGTLGLARDAAVGFSAIRVGVAIEGDITPEQQRDLAEKSESYCVVLQTLREAPPIEITWQKS